ncbi:MAG TPA: biotin/lipoyl-binding protein, partial [Pyrinomonadaceae bacterium]|nr:biotin/lipoyl-binding protein [Pyrinomonadaceae bacterium]
MNTKSGRLFYVPLVTLILALGLISVGCNRKGKAKTTIQAPPPTVIVEEIIQKTVPIYSEYVGQTRAEETVELRARVEGILQKVYFREGMPVSKGQLLFTIDKRTFQA